MLPPIDTKLICDGFCCGEYSTVIGEGNRLRLPNDLAQLLKQNNISELWRFLDPTDQRFILCPPKFVSVYKEVALNHFPADMNHEEAFRKFICSGKPTQMAKYNRIRINAVCLSHSRIKEGDRVDILGVGLWFEVSRNRKG